MPELPEIQTLSSELQRKISGLVLSDFFVSAQARLNASPDDLRKKLVGKKILGVLRRGKFLSLKIENEISLWIHLGMTGQLVWRHEDVPVDRHDHLVLFFRGFRERLFFRDPRRFGRLCLANGNPAALPPGIRLLGPEPFELTAPAFARLFKTRTGRVKNLLLNQRLMAGLGNIYADESLHRAGIRPRSRAHRIPRAKLESLHASICETLDEAIRCGGSSIDDYRRTDGSRGTFQQFHRVYGRQKAACFHCGTLIRRIRLAGRSSYFCPQCQK